MESELFEIILFGQFNRDSFSGFKGSVNLPVLGFHEQIPEDRQGFYHYRDTLLKHWPEQGRKIEWSKAESVDPPWEKTITDEERYYSIVVPEVANSETSYLIKALECESRRLMTAAVSFGTWNEEDCLYQVTLSLRKWTDYLTEANTQHTVMPGDEGFKELALGVLKAHLIALICELCDRYRYLPLPVHYTLENIYPNVLESIVPEPGPVQKTAAWYQHKAHHIIDNGDAGSNILKLLNAINAAGRTPDYLELLQVQYELENAFFLIFYEAPFIKNNRDKLTNHHFTQQWIQGLKQESLAEQDFEKLKTIILKLNTAARKMRTIFGPYQQHEQPGYPLSEAMQFVREIETAGEGVVNNYSAGAVHVPDTQEESPHTGVSYIQKLRDKFMTSQEVDEVLRLGSRNTIDSFLKTSGFRYVEVSRQNKLIFREDVEDYIKKNTKKFRAS